MKRDNTMDAAQSTHDAGTKQAIQIPPVHRKKSQKVKHRPRFIHPLSGDMKGKYSIRVTGNWRITFRLENGDVFDVNLEDYHGK